jgi:replicative DNA helicase
MLQDKRAILQVLGCLIKNPSLLVTHNTMNLDRDDFPERFHKMLFASISNLYSNGVEKIDAFEVDSYLTPYKTQYEVFVENDGVAYIETAAELAQLDNFEYNAKRIKKFSLLRELQKVGYDVSEVFVEDDETILNAFDKMGVDDIIDHYEIRLMDLKAKFNADEDSIQAGKGLMELMEQYIESPDLGIPFPQKTITRVLRGFRKRKLYLHSALTGRGKTRFMAAFALYQAVQYKEPVLFITSEQEKDEIQTLLPAFLAKINEEKFLLGKYTQEEKESVQKAIEQIKEIPLYIQYMSDFTPEKIENSIKRHKILYNIQYVYFDYIKTTVEMLQELANKARVSDLKTHNILYIFTEKLKRLANKLNIGIYTATQLTAETYKAKEYNENLLRGAKAIADAIDVGIIIREVDDGDKDVFAGKLEEYAIPDLCFHIYKNRRGMKDVDIWLKADHGTCHYEEVLSTQYGKKLEIAEFS